MRCMLEIPQVFRCNNRTVCIGMEGLCVVIRRLAYPNRLDDLSPLFGRTKCRLLWTSGGETTRCWSVKRKWVEIDMHRHMTTPNNEVYCVYGDPAYPLTPYIIPPFKGAVLSANQARFNKRMSSVRICVESGFGKLLNLFAFLDYKKNHKLYLQPIGKYYKVAALLANCHTCFYGSETGSFFGLNPPSLQEYLHR